MDASLPALLLPFGRLCVEDVETKWRERQPCSPGSDRRTQFKRAATGIVLELAKQREEAAKLPQLQSSADESVESSFPVYKDNAGSSQRGFDASLVIVLQCSDIVKEMVKSLIPFIQKMLTSQLSGRFRRGDEVVLFFVNKPLSGDKGATVDGVKYADFVSGFTSIHSLHPGNVDGKVVIWEQDERLPLDSAMRWVVTVDARLTNDSHRAQMKAAIPGSVIPVENSENYDLMLKAWVLSVLYHEISAHISYSLEPGKGLIARLREAASHNDTIVYGYNCGYRTIEIQSSRGQSTGMQPADYMQNEKNEHFFFMGLIKMLSMQGMKIVQGNVQYGSVPTSLIQPLFKGYIFASKNVLSLSETQIGTLLSYIDQFLKYDLEIMEQSANLTSY